MAGEIAGTAAQKAALRKQILAARDAQNAATRAAASAAITRELLALDAWRNARCVLVYLNFGSEFDTTALVADRLGRDCIGIELNPEYADMAKRRIEGDAGMFAEVNHG